MMIDFKNIEIKDREWIDEKLRESDFRGCEYSFVNNFIWQKPYEIKYANINDFYCIRGGDKNSVYAYPAGKGDIRPVIEILIKEAKEKGEKFKLRGITLENIEKLNELFPNKFDFEPKRDEFDYVYEVSKLSTLSGRKLHGKRNHIARFKDNPDWSYEPITEKNIDECFKMNNEWCSRYNCIEDESLNHELCAVKEAFKNFFDLKMLGGLIRREGKIVGYTMASHLNSDTLDVNIEKAFPEIQGAYPMINQQFVLNECQNFKYVNREEDVGDEGLRKAKLSYVPDILLEKYTATLKEEK